MSGHSKWCEMSKKMVFRKNLRMDECAGVCKNFEKFKRLYLRSVITQPIKLKFVMEVKSGLRFYNVLNFLKNITTLASANFKRSS